jgi:hypothetical protein
MKWPYGSLSSLWIGHAVDASARVVARRMLAALVWQGLLQYLWTLPLVRGGWGTRWRTGRM